MASILSLWSSLSACQPPRLLSCRIQSAPQKVLDPERPPSQQPGPPPPFPLPDGICCVKWHWLIPFPRRVTLFSQVCSGGEGTGKRTLQSDFQVFERKALCSFFFQKFSYSDGRGHLGLLLTGSAVILRKVACCLRETTKSCWSTA